MEFPTQKRAFLNQKYPFLRRKYPLLNQKPAFLNQKYPKTAKHCGTPQPSVFLAVSTLWIGVKVRVVQLIMMSGC